MVDCLLKIPYVVALKQHKLFSTMLLKSIFFLETFCLTRNYHSWHSSRRLCDTFSGPQLACLLPSHPGHQTVRLSWRPDKRSTQNFTIWCKLIGIEYAHKISLAVCLWFSHIICYKKQIYLLKIVKINPLNMETFEEAIYCLDKTQLVCS